MHSVSRFRDELAAGNNLFSRLIAELEQSLKVDALRPQQN